MIRRRHPMALKWLGGSILSVLLVCGFVGGLQPLLDKLLGGGTLLAMNARAEEQAPPSAEAAAPAQTDTKGETARQPEKPTREVFQSDPLATLALAMQNKERELAERERRVKESEDRLDILRGKITKDLAEVEQKRDELKLQTDKFQTELEAKRAKDVKKWFEIYQTMAPQKAALVLEEMETTTAREILSKMESKKATKILDSMNRARAVELVGTGLQKGNR